MNLKEILAGPGISYWLKDAKGLNGAAELLGVKPTTLISRMGKMGLKRPS